MVLSDLTECDVTASSLMDSVRLREGVSTVTELLEKRAREQPDRLAYRALERGQPASGQLSYAELHARACATAAALLSRGAPGQRVLLVFPPGLDFPVAFFGTLLAEAIAVPVVAPDRRSLERGVMRLAAVAENCAATFLLTTPELLARRGDICALVPALDRLEWLSLAELPATTGGPESLASSASSDGLALLQYTSGSTAAPRGVKVTHANLLTNCEQVRRAFHQNEECVVVSWLPMHHDMGLIGCLLQPLYCGYPGYLMSPTEFIKHPVRWLQAVSEVRATISGGPNFAYDLCVRGITDEQRRELDLSSWRVAFCGAEPVHASTLQRFCETFRDCGFAPESLYPCYGLAEATLIVSGSRGHPLPTRVEFDDAALSAGVAQAPAPGTSGRTLVSCGQATDGQEIRIVAPGTRHTLPEDRVGEVWVSGPSVAAGYWNQPDLDGLVFAVKTSDGEGPFLRTGDLGFLRDGELYVCGRLKDMIIVRGRNHHPEDIERNVQEAVPEVRVGGVVAFGVPRLEHEEVVVVLEAPAALVQGERAAQVTQRVREAVSLAHSIALADVVLVKPGTLRRTTSGKLARSACRADYQATRDGGA